MKRNIEIAAAFAAGLGVIFANSGYVEFVLESLQIKVRFLE